MTLNLSDYDRKVREAVGFFWSNRRSASLRQQEAGVGDRGERASVTAGKNMDGFLDLIRDITRDNGLTEADIHVTRRVLTLPGFFRPTKQWDMLIMNNGELVAALEFKSQVGPSFGNNFNNRAEEAIGSALDFWTSFREGAFGQDAPKPFVGWFILVEDSQKSRDVVTSQSPNFNVFPEFENTSYAQRYGILCRKLVREQLYTAACSILSPRSAEISGEYAETNNGLVSVRAFVARLAGHIASETARTS